MDSSRIPKFLVDALQAEVEDDQQLREHERRATATKDRLGKALASAADAGTPYGLIALVSFDLRHGRRPTMEERQTEAARLRKLRQRVTRSHGFGENLAISSGAVH